MLVYTFDPKTGFVKQEIVYDSGKNTLRLPDDPEYGHSKEMPNGLPVLTKGPNAVESTPRGALRVVHHAFFFPKKVEGVTVKYTMQKPAMVTDNCVVYTGGEEHVSALNMEPIAGKVYCMAGCLIFLAPHATVSLKTREGKVVVLANDGGEILSGSREEMEEVILKSVQRAVRQMQLEDNK